jgi:hypothetical protein
MELPLPHAPGPGDALVVDQKSLAGLALEKSESGPLHESTDGGRARRRSAPPHLLPATARNRLIRSRASGLPCSLPASHIRVHARAARRASEAYGRRDPQQTVSSRLRATASCMRSWLRFVGACCSRCGRSRFRGFFAFLAGGNSAITVWRYVASYCA